MEKVSHHYIPQFYLKNYSSNKKSIGMFINSTSSYVEQASIKKQACKDHLYGEGQEIEDELMGLEAKASGIIKRIIETSTMPDYDTEEYHLLLFFMMISEARVQKEADSNTNLLSEQARVMAKMYKDHGRLDISENSINNLNVTADVPNLMPMQVAAESYPILLDMHAALIIIHNDRNFITSDNPVARYNYMYVERNYSIRGYGLGNMGAQLFFPISPKHCIYIYDGVLYNTHLSSEKRIILEKGKQVDELNKLFYLNSYNFLFFTDTTRVSYIKSLTSSIKHDNRVEKEVHLFGTKDDVYIMYQNNYVKEKIRMPFLQINQRFKNMKLPQHMAGPVRPYAMKFNKD